MASSAAKVDVHRLPDGAGGVDARPPGLVREADEVGVGEAELGRGKAGPLHVHEVEDVGVGGRRHHAGGQDDEVDRQADAVPEQRLAEAHEELPAGAGLDARHAALGEVHAGLLRHPAVERLVQPGRDHVLVDDVGPGAGLGGVEGMLERRHVEDVGAEGEVLAAGTVRGRGSVAGRAVPVAPAQPGPGPGDDGHASDRAAVRRADEGAGTGHLLEGDVGDDVGDVGHAETVEQGEVGLPAGGHDDGTGRELGAAAVLIEGDHETAGLAGHGGHLGCGVNGDTGMGRDLGDEFVDADGLEFAVGRPGREEPGEAGRPAAELRLPFHEVDVVAGVRRLQGGGEAGDAAADDEQPGVDVAILAVGPAGPQETLDPHADVVLGQGLCLRLAGGLAPGHHLPDVHPADHVDAEGGGEKTS